MLLTPLIMITNLRHRNHSNMGRRRILIVEIALHTEFESSVSELDTLLYKAKENGRNCAYGRVLNNNKIIKVTTYSQANNTSVTTL